MRALCSHLTRLCGAVPPGGVVGAIGVVVDARTEMARLRAVLLHPRAIIVVTPSQVDIRKAVW